MPLSALKEYCSDTWAFWFPWGNCCLLRCHTLYTFIFCDEIHCMELGEEAGEAGSIKWGQLSVNLCQWLSFPRCYGFLYCTPGLCLLFWTHSLFFSFSTSSAPLHGDCFIGYLTLDRLQRDGQDVFSRASVQGIWWEVWFWWSWLWCSVLGWAWEMVWHYWTKLTKHVPGIPYIVKGTRKD